MEQIEITIIKEGKDILITSTEGRQIKITQNKFVEYTCGNIRIKFIDKLLKERRK